MSVKYGWQYYFEPTPKNVSKWLLALRAVIGLVQAAAIYEHMDWRWQLALLAIGGAIHEFGMMISEVPNQEKES
jgi:hypothetical protein